MIKNKNVLTSWMQFKSVISQIKEKLDGEKIPYKRNVLPSMSVLETAKNHFTSFWMVVQPCGSGWLITDIKDSEIKISQPGNLIIRYDAVEFRLLKELTPTWEI